MISSNVSQPFRRVSFVATAVDVETQVFDGTLRLAFGLFDGLRDEFVNAMVARTKLRRMWQRTVLPTQISRAEDAHESPQPIANRTGPRLD